MQCNTRYDDISIINYQLYTIPITTEYEVIDSKQEKVRRNRSATIQGYSLQLTLLVLRLNHVRSLGV